VPDFYQGTETWDLSLVDPDNRRPVDFAARRAALAAAGEPGWAALASNWTDGQIKLALTHRLLSLRNEMPEVFRSGAYEPIEVAGPHRDHIISFRRFAGREQVVIVAARHFAAMTGYGSHWPNGWQAELKLDRRYGHGLRDALGSAGATSENLDVSHLLGVLPVAVLRNG
jgi:(1->4)-alpha-D-glucan 1-alpha-D-glucosylmutase